MELDAVGSRDEMAIVLSKTPLDYQALNNAANAAAGNYSAKMTQALKGKLQSEVSFSAGDVIGLKTVLAENQAVVMVIGIDKR